MLQTLNLQVVSAGQFEEVSLTASIPELTRVGKEFNWKIAIAPVNEIHEVNFEVYDPCIFAAKPLDSDKQSWDVIRGNRSVQHTMTYMVGETNFERTCDVKFKMDYKSNATASQTIIVLTTDEYGQREVAGTLGQIPTPSSSSTSPFQVAISTNPKQPFLDDTDVQVYFDYATSGVGFISSLKQGDVVARMPSNLINPRCDDFSLQDGKLVLSREIPFSGGKGLKRSTCTFTTKASSPVDSEPIILTATYGYEIDESVPIKVRP